MLYSALRCRLPLLCRVFEIHVLHDYGELPYSIDHVGKVPGKHHWERGFSNQGRASLGFRYDGMLATAIATAACMVAIDS